MKRFEVCTIEKLAMSYIVEAETVEKARRLIEEWEIAGSVDEYLDDEIDFTDITEIK